MACKAVTGEELKREYDMLQTGEQYLVRAYYSEEGKENAVNEPMAAAMGNSELWFLLDQLMDNGFYFYQIPEDGAIHYDENLSGFKESLEMVKENQHSMSVIGTKDMSVIPEVQDSSRMYFLSDGRWLHLEDNKKNNKVCVVHANFAQRRGLSVGDKIAINIRDMGGSWFGYICSKGGTEWKQWKTYEIVEDEFEIVGIYDNVTGDFPLTAYSNELYIPDSCMPKDFRSETRKEISPYYYSFVLKSAEEQEKFLSMNRNALEEMGISVSFVDNNAENFGISAREIKKSTMTSVLLSVPVFLLAMVLSAVLYLDQLSREYAIARALGIPPKTAVCQMGATVGCIGLAGIGIGSTAAWYQTLRSADDLLKEFAVQEGGIHRPSISTAWLIIIIFGIFLVFQLLVLLGSFYLSRRPVLELLQGKAGARKKKKLSAMRRQKIYPAKSDNKHLESDRIPFTGNSMIKELVQRGYKSRGNKNIWTVSCIFRHLSRTLGRTLLMLGVSIGLITAFGWLHWATGQVETEVERIYETTEIQGKIVKSESGMIDFEKGRGFIKPQIVEKLKNSGFIAECDLERTSLAENLMAISEDGTMRMEEAVKNVPILSFNNWEYFVNGTGKNLSIKFLQDYDEDFFMMDSVEQQNVIFPEERLNALGIQVGDMIYLRSGELYSDYLVIGSYQGSLPNSLMDNPIFMQSTGMDELVKDDYNYFSVDFKFDSSQNRKLLEEGGYLKEMVEDSQKNGIGLTLIIWDEELRQVLEPMDRNLAFLKQLNPVVAIVFTFFGCILNVRLVMQRSQEAAVMRILGRTIKSIRMIFIEEHLFLCLLGIVFGIAGIRTIQGIIPVYVLVNIGVYAAGSTIGALCGSIIVTNRKPLELLQEKE